MARQVLSVEPVGAVRALAHLGGVDLAAIDVLLSAKVLAVRAPLAPNDVLPQATDGGEVILGTLRTSTL